MQRWGAPAGGRETGCPGKKKNDEVPHNRIAPGQPVTRRRPERAGLSIGRHRPLFLSLAGGLVAQLLCFSPYKLLATMNVSSHSRLGCRRGRSVPAFDARHDGFLCLGLVEPTEASCTPNRRISSFAWSQPSAESQILQLSQSRRRKSGKATRRTGFQEPTPLSVRGAPNQFVELPTSHGRIPGSP